MRMYSYDQVLTDVKDVYEQITGLPAPEIDLKKARYPLPKGINPVALVQSEINQLNMCLINSVAVGEVARMGAPRGNLRDPGSLYNQPGVAGVEPGRRQSDSDQQYPHGPRRAPLQESERGGHLSQFRAKLRNV